MNGFAEMNTKRLLETALRREDLTRIGDKEKEPRVAMLQLDKNENKLSQLFS